jgi:GTPase SAR1 family protein
MDVEAALELAEALILPQTGKHLNDLQKCVFKEAWQGNSFTEIAESCNCNESYAKEVGSQLWKLLSSALGEPVGKKNLKPPLERRWKAQQSGKISNQDSVTHKVPQSTLDSNFVGRENAIANPSQEEVSTHSQLEATVQAKIKRTLEEQANISQERLFGIEKYLIDLQKYLQDKEGSWFISIVGTGGVGKTSIVEKLVREHTVDSGFIDLAWVTAKRTYFRVENRSIRNIETALNIDGLVSDIAEQLQIGLPSTVAEHFSYLQSQLKAAPYLIIIDNLETLDDYKELLEKFYSHGKTIKPSKIIFTSRQKIQKLSFDVREVELKGINLNPTLDLIRYKGGHISRISEASDDELLPIFKASNGIPLLILLVVSLIATDDSPLEEIIQSLVQQDKLYKYLYEEALSSISDNAFKILTSMAEFSESSPVSRQQLSKQAELGDDEFKVAVGECIERSLLTSISKSLSDEPRYSIHNLLYAFLRELKSSD